MSPAFRRQSVMKQNIQITNEKPPEGGTQNICAAQFIKSILCDCLTRISRMTFKFLFVSFVLFAAKSSFCAKPILCGRQDSAQTFPGLRIKKSLPKTDSFLPRVPRLKTDY